MKGTILAACMDMVTVYINGAALPCNPGLIKYINSERTVMVGARKITGINGKWPSLIYKPREVRITGVEFLFRSSFE